jgi:hypothetical protein
VEKHIRLSGGWFSGHFHPEYFLSIVQLQRHHSFEESEFGHFIDGYFEVFSLGTLFSANFYNQHVKQA